MSETRIRILIVDDHLLVREGVARLVSGEPDFQVVGQCSTVQEGLDLLTCTEVDIVLLDIDLGEDRGSGLLLEARMAGFTGRFLAVTAGASPSETAELLRLGAAGVFLKHSPPQELANSIRAVMRGESWVDPNFSVSTGHEEGGQGAVPRKLTRREQLVLRGVMEGMANKQIAANLYLSESSVKGTLQQLFEKTGVRTRSQLVRIALERYLDQI